MIESRPQMLQYFKESVEFFLHFLVMASALFGLSGFYEIGHGFEDFVGSSEVLIDEMLAVYFQEPMVEFILFVGPVPL